MSRSNAAQSLPVTDPGQDFRVCSADCPRDVYSWAGGLYLGAVCGFGGCVAALCKYRMLFASAEELALPAALENRGNAQVLQEGLLGTFEPCRLFDDYAEAFVIPSLFVFLMSLNVLFIIVQEGFVVHVATVKSWRLGPFRGDGLFALRTGQLSSFSQNPLLRPVKALLVYSASVCHIDIVGGYFRKLLDQSPKTERLLSCLRDRDRQH